MERAIKSPEHTLDSQLWVLHPRSHNHWPPAAPCHWRGPWLGLIWHEHPPIPPTPQGITLAACQRRWTLSRRQEGRAKESGILAGEQAGAQSKPVCSAISSAGVVAGNEEYFAFLFQAKSLPRQRCSAFLE